MTYSAFGLSLAASSALSGLAAGSDASAIDVRIRLDGAWPDIRHLPRTIWYTGDAENGITPDLRVWNVAERYFTFRYDDGVEFALDRAGNEIWAKWPESSTLEDAATYLLGPVLGLALRLRGVVCLHASAVAFGGRALLLAGPPEAGKSTAAAAFWQRGHAILSDDIAPIVERDGVPYVQPGYPQLRLWPDSVALLYGSADALPRLTPTWEKRALDLTARPAGFQQQALPIAAIYVIDERSKDATPRIERLSGCESVMALVANSYTGYMLEPSMRAEELTFLTRIAGTVPILRLVPAGSLRPAALCGRILEDCEAMGCTASATMAT
jgi:hypothetical protein